MGCQQADVGSGVALHDPEIGEQEGDRLGCHRCAPVGVDGEGSRHDGLPLGSVGDEPLGEGRALSGGDHPARNVAGASRQGTCRPGGRGRSANPSMTLTITATSIGAKAEEPRPGPPGGLQLPCLLQERSRRRAQWAPPRTSLPQQHRPTAPATQVGRTPSPDASLRRPCAGSRLPPADGVRATPQTGPRRATRSARSAPNSRRRST
jgi:hypothetical protein